MDFAAATTFTGDLTVAFAAGEQTFTVKLVDAVHGATAVGHFDFVTGVVVRVGVVAVVVVVVVIVVVLIVVIVLIVVMVVMIVMIVLVQMAALVVINTFHNHQPTKEPFPIPRFPIIHD